MSTLHEEELKWFPLIPESLWRQQYEEQARQNRQLEKELKQLQEDLAKQKGDKGSHYPSQCGTQRIQVNRDSGTSL